MSGSVRRLQASAGQSRAVAEAVARNRPEVICAYPIAPQTHIVEALSATVKAQTLASVVP
jgi:pyruvate ferredoxin oxidoreductase alpha subunit